MATDQSCDVLRLLQQFLTRAAADHSESRMAILEHMRKIRQKQAEQDFEAMEKNR